MVSRCRCPQLRRKTFPISSALGLKTTHKDILRLQSNIGYIQRNDVEFIPKHVLQRSVRFLFDCAVGLEDWWFRSPL